jgi:RNA polymerase sigma factor (sigma-70 family)
MPFVVVYSQSVLIVKFNLYTMNAAKYNKSRVMKMAWVMYRRNNGTLSWSDSLKQAWNIEKNGVAKNTIETLYNNHYKEVYNRILFKVNGKHEIAEELTQDVFIKANEHLQKYDVMKAKMKTWLYTIANNKVIDYYRSNATNQSINVSNFVNTETGKELFQFTDSEETNTQAENNEFHAKVRKIFNNLNPKYRKIAMLYFLSQMEYSEISAMCNVPMGTVKGTINRCREMLKDDFKKERAENRPVKLEKEKIEYTHENIDDYYMEECKNSLVRV